MKSTATRTAKEDEEMNEQEWAAQEAARIAVIERYESTFPDWRRLGLTYRCPRHVADEGCKAFSPDADRRKRVCVCQRYPGLLAYRRQWRLPDGERVLTSEPTAVPTEELERLRAECADLGLEVVIGEGSPIDPKGRFLVQVRKAEG